MRPFGELEAAVMDRLWSYSRPVTVREVLEDLRPSRPLAYTTVMTVLDNLYRKGVADRELDGRAYRYRPVRSREEHCAQLMQEVLAASSDRTATLTRFFEQMSPAEVAQVRRELEAATAARARDAGGNGR